MKRPSKAAAAAAQKRSVARRSLPEGETRKSDNSRLRILDAAAHVLSREGYAGTRLVDIAKRAKLKISTLYYYFESREELVLDVLLTGIERVKLHAMEVVATLPPEVSPVDRVCAAAEAHLRYILEISDYTEATIRNTGQLPQHMRTTVAKEQGDYGRFWQGLVDDAVAGNPTAYASLEKRRALRLLIIGALNWTVEWWVPGRVSVDEVVETALTVVRGALATQGILTQELVEPQAAGVLSQASRVKQLSEREIQSQPNVDCY